VQKRTDSNRRKQLGELRRSTSGHIKVTVLVLGAYRIEVFSSDL
jgi:hypothetical protein